MSDTMVRWVGTAKKALAPRDHTRSAVCVQCSLTSHLPDDVESRFCSHCQEFYDLMDISDAKGVVTVWNR
jgi:hypothetical protein